jgi:low temperature requirement protein LtrA
VIAHPTDELPTPEVLAVVGGPAIYLLGHVLFRLRMAGSISWRRLAGAIACAALGVVGTAITALALASLVVAVLIGVIVAERIANRRREQRGEPSPLERLEAAAGAGG